jgi:hypothetical protein
MFGLWCKFFEALAPDSYERMGFMLQISVLTFLKTLNLILQEYCTSSVSFATVMNHIRMLVTLLICCWACTLVGGGLRILISRLVCDYQSSGLQVSSVDILDFKEPSSSWYEWWWLVRYDTIRLKWKGEIMDSCWLPTWWWRRLPKTYPKCLIRRFQDLQTVLLPSLFLDCFRYGWKFCVSSFPLYSLSTISWNMSYFNLDQQACNSWYFLRFDAVFCFWTCCVAEVGLGYC